MLFLEIVMVVTQEFHDEMKYMGSTEVLVFGGRGQAVHYWPSDLTVARAPLMSDEIEAKVTFSEFIEEAEPLSSSSDENNMLWRRFGLWGRDW